MVQLKSAREMAVMREAALILKQVLGRLRDFVRPGLTTASIDQEAEKWMRKLGARPAFLGYRGFPASICTSINEEVVHGIPSERKLIEGDILSVDVGVVYHGYYSDAARTWPVGQVRREARQLMDVTEKAFDQGITHLARGLRLGDLGHSIQRYVEGQGYSVVRDYVGHGIGRELHEDPQVPNYGEPGHGLVVEEGLVIAIEPMVNAGSPQVKVLGDGWTVVTRDGSLSAHYEETVAVTEHGPEILTRFEEA